MKKSADRDLIGNQMSPSGIQSPSAYRLLVRIGGAVAASIGCTALLGWVLGFPRLASLGHGLIPMAPSTAILFVAYGFALLLARRATCDRRAMLLFLSIFAAGAFVSFSLFILSSLGVYLDIEHFGIKAMGAVDGTPIGHMSPITAFSFLLISLSFLAAITSRPDRNWQAKAAWWIAIILLAAYAMLGLAYLFGTPMFYGGTFIPPAATTSLAFVALGIALLALSLPVAWSESNRRDHGERYSFRLLVVVFLFLVAGIISAGYFYHRNHQKHYLAEVERQLSAIADLKLGELVLWREERLGNAGVFHSNTAFASLVKTYFQHPEAKQARRGIEAWIGRIKENRNYNRIVLLDAQGNSRLSLPETTAEPLSRYVRQRAIESLHSGRITFADFYRTEFTGKIYLSILVPILDPAHEGDALGVLVMRIDPEKYLYPFIQRWPNASTTAETLLVRREGNEVVFLNQLRFKKNSALNLRIPLENTYTPSVMAVLGREGVVRGIDYRGKPVLAALRSIPDSPWYLVSRIDADEVYAPLRERQWITVLLVSAMLVSAGTGVGFVWRQQSSRFYRDKYETELERIELEERLVKVAANVPGVIFQFQLRPDGSSFLPYASSGLEAAYGLQPEDVAQDASPLFAVIHPDDSPRVTETILESARTLSAWRNEHRVLHPHKGEIWLEGNATPELKPDGSVLLHGFITDITERKRAGAELYEKTAELERFTYMISHDLKSPVVTVKTFLGYLEQDLARSDAARIEKDMLYIHTAADKMGQMLDELLEMSRVGRVVNPTEHVTFRELVEEALSMVAGPVAERGVAVLVDDEAITLSGDRPRLVEIWQNLLENAVKFMGDQPSPRVEIGAQLRGRETVFFVQDNGVGVDMRYSEKVFGLFEKLDPRSDGSGLGLALVKRVVELYQGTIWLESEGLGQGACFRFTLPAAMQGNVKGDK